MLVVEEDRGAGAGLGVRELDVHVLALEGLHLEVPLLVQVVALQLDGTLLGARPGQALLLNGQAVLLEGEPDQHLCLPHADGLVSLVGGRVVVEVVAVALYEPLCHRRLQVPQAYLAVLLLRGPGERRPADRVARRRDLQVAAWLPVLAAARNQCGRVRDAVAKEGWLYRHARGLLLLLVVGDLVGACDRRVEDVVEKQGQAVA